MQDPNLTQPSNPLPQTASDALTQQNLPKAYPPTTAPAPIPTAEETSRAALSPYTPSYQPPPLSYQSAPPRPPAPGQHRRRGCMLSPGCLFSCLGMMLVLFVALLIGSFALYYQLNNRLAESIADLEASLSNIDDPNSASGFESSFVYDRNGAQLWEIFGQGRRQRVSLDQIPPYVIQATLAVEDDDFYTHPGFDVWSNLRALRDYVRYRQVVSGASTITQQLVRNVVFDPEYRREISVERKVEEIALAFVLTQRLSKDETLELYLNTIYYGNLSYGIESASQTYFGKSTRDLQLHEAALLAGLPQLPAIIDPLNPDPQVQSQLLARQYLILDLMVEEGYISQAEANSAKAQPLNYVSPEVPLIAPHFTLYAIEELEGLLLSLGKPPELLADGGLKVYTTLNSDFQAVAQRAAETQVAALRERHNLTNASVVVIHPPSGEILAMVGSIDYNDSTIDGQVNVSVAQRQPGSTMKPFTYAAAMELGWDASTIIWDVETPFPVQGQADYIPLNYDRRFHGAVRLRDALANSYNVPAVKALEFVGLDYFINYMKRIGTESLSTEPGRYGLSLTLGGGEITLLEMTTNYATLARDGVFIPSTPILCVLDRDDNIIYQYENRCPRGNVTEQSILEYVRATPVIDPRIAFVISDILSDNNARTPAMGANSPLNTGSLVSSVKTGTTDNFRDNWTVGYTRDLAVGVWSGNSNNDPMIDISGLGGAAPIWNSIITEIYRRFDMPPSAQLIVPQGMTQRKICDLRGLRDPATTCGTRNEWFLDSPPLIPDGNGGLTYAAVPPPPQGPPPSQFGPQLTLRETGLWEVIVRPLDDAQKAIAQTQFPGLYATPLYCMVPVEVLGSVPDARAQLFIEPPSNPAQQSGAYRYAVNNGIPILPQIPCTAETITAFSAPPGVSAVILSPTTGQVVKGVIPIYGVVDFPDGQFYEYYKVEVRGGPFPDWTTMGQVHYNEVLQPAVLETFYAEALPSGPYELRLWLQGVNPVEYVVGVTLAN